MRRWKIISIILLGLLVLAGTTACGSDKEESSQRLAEVVRGDLAISVSGSGNIETYREALLTFGSGGRIDSINAQEGDKVSKGDVLAILNTDSLELAKTQAQVALTQAQIALTQAQIAQQTAEFELDSTLDKKDTLELAKFNAQITLDQAKLNLEQTQDLFIWSDIKAVQADVDEAEDYLEYSIEQLSKYLPETEGEYPNILEYVLDEDSIKLPGYKVWQERIVHAQSRLTTAEDRLNSMLAGTDIKEVALKKLQIESAEMSMSQAKRNLYRLTGEIAIKELQIQVAKDSIEQAKQSVELAQQSLNDAQKNIDEATIIAPLTGVVANVYVKEGDLIPAPTVAPQTIFHLIDPTSMELIVELDEIDVPGVRLAQEAIIEIDALPDDEFEGIVTTIYPLPTTVGGIVLYNVKIALEVPESSDLKIGMSASVDIIINKRSNVLLVPDRAIKQDDQGKPYVRVMINKQIEERTVVTGISDGYQTEILDGLKEGEKVESQAKPK